MTLTVQHQVPGVHANYVMWQCLFNEIIMFSALEGHYLNGSSYGVLEIWHQFNYWTEIHSYFWQIISNLILIHI